MIDEGVDIAVIDEDAFSGQGRGDYGFFKSLKQEHWNEYRKTHPDRLFILIQPRLGTTFPPILPPNGFNNNGYKIEVSRPGDGGSSTNWYAVIQEIIDISSYNNFRIIVDNSGSMTTKTVTPDLQNFILKLKSFSRAQFYNADGFAPLQTLTIPADPTSSPFYSEFWIQPFIVDDIDFLV